MGDNTQCYVENGCIKVTTLVPTEICSYDNESLLQEIELIENQIKNFDSINEKRLSSFKDRLSVLNGYMSQLKKG